MKTKYVDNGYPVILGEFAAMARPNLGSAAANEDHAKYRLYYMRYISNSIKSHGLVPMYWDAGFTGDKGSGLFNWNNGDKVFPDIISALTTNN